MRRAPAPRPRPGPAPSPVPAPGPGPHCARREAGPAISMRGGAAGLGEPHGSGSGSGAPAPGTGSRGPRSHERRPPGAGCGPFGDWGAVGGGGTGVGRTDDSNRRLEEILKVISSLPPASKQDCPSTLNPDIPGEGAGSAALSAPTCTDSGSSSWGFISKPLPYNFCLSFGGGGAILEIVNVGRVKKH